MRLLLDFLLRFGWGLSVALVATPAAIVPAGFFRVNLLVVLGVATGAAICAGGAGGWARIWAVAAAVVAWLGSVAWLLDARRAGLAACGACGLLLAAATADAAGAGRGAWGVAIEPLVSGLVTGLTVHAMLLGHWYLNAPGMRVDALRRMIDLALAAWALRLVGELAPFAVAPWPVLPSGAAATALVALRWLAGLAGLPILLVMARKTLDIPNTQSATGILYVACLAAILGELTAQLLRAAA